MASVEARLAALAETIRRRQFAHEGPMDALSRSLEELEGELLGLDDLGKAVLLAELNREGEDGAEAVDLTPEDLEEFSKEYLNVLCGKVTGALYRATQIPARFGQPVFYHGRYEPEGQEVQFILTYADEHSKGAQLIHHVPCAPEAQAASDEIEQGGEIQ